MQVRSRIPHTPQRRSSPFLSSGSCHLLRNSTGRTRLTRQLNDLAFGRRIRNEDVVAACVAEFSAHVMQQQVAEDASDFSDVFRVAIGTANFRKQCVSAFDVSFVDLVSEGTLLRSGQITDVTDQCVALCLVQIESRRHVVRLLRMPGLRMVRNVQPDFDCTRRHDEITERRLLRLPAKSPGRSIFQTSHPPADFFVLRLFGFQLFQNLGRNRIDQSGSEQRGCVPLRFRDHKVAVPR